MTQASGESSDLSATRKRPWYAVSRRMAGFAVATVVFVITLALFFVDVGPPQWKQQRSQCQGSLRQLGYALDNYAQRKGHYPADLAQLYAPHVAEYPTCPTSGKPYVYRSANIAWPAPAGTVLAHDEPSDHESDGEPKIAYFLFADSLVSPVPIEIARRVIADLDAGHNPPRVTELEEIWKKFQGLTQPTSRAATSSSPM
jgi:hypothetical protein